MCKNREGKDARVFSGANAATLRPSRPNANLISGAEQLPKLAALLVLVLVLLPLFEEPELAAAVVFAAAELDAIFVAMFALVVTATEEEAAAVDTAEETAEETAAHERAGAPSVPDAKAMRVKAVKSDFENIVSLNEKKRG